MSSFKVQPSCCLASTGIYASTAVKLHCCSSSLRLRLRSIGKTAVPRPCCKRRAGCAWFSSISSGRAGLPVRGSLDHSAFAACSRRRTATVRDIFVSQDEPRPGMPRDWRRDPRAISQQAPVADPEEGGAAFGRLGPLPRRFPRPPLYSLSGGRFAAVVIAAISGRVDLRYHLSQ